ncbi:MAG: hypothetical protein ACJAS9_001504 [Polaribacter sp.]|jgi:uncharacterized protein YjiK
MAIIQSNEINFNLMTSLRIINFLNIFVGFVKQGAVVSMLAVFLLACNAEDEEGDDETPIVQKTLFLEVSGSGSVSDTNNMVDCQLNCNTEIDENTNVVLNAVAAVGYRFLQWNGACKGSGGCNVDMDTDKTVAAVFIEDDPEPETFTLTLSKTGNGTISSDPSGLDCGNSCNADFALNTSVTLTAVASSGYVFDRWTGACSGSNDCSVSMNANKSVNAVFNEESSYQDYTLSVVVNGSGNVNSSPSGINCGSDCSELYPENSQIDLTASPNAGWMFNGWSGSCSGQSSCTVTMNANKTVTATYIVETEITHLLTVNLSGDGSVTSNPVGINCGSDCSELYVENTEIDLTANPNAGWLFSGWSGSCSGQSNCTVIMNANKTVTATYEEEPETTYLLTVSLSGDGSVTSSPVGIDCGSDCSEEYIENTQVDLTANASTGFVFSSWSGECSGAASCSISMNTAKSVTATFVDESPEKFDLDVVVSGSGNVTSSPSGIDCGSDCNESYDDGTLVSLSAASDDGFKFQQWSGSCNGSGACDVTVDTAKSVTAEFVALQDFDLTVTVTGSGSVTSDPTGIDCGGDCSQTFEENTNVTITAIADSGFKLDHWENTCTGNGSCSFDMDNSKSLTAVFVEDVVPDVLIENYSPSGDAFTLGEIPKDASGITWHAGIQQYLIVQNNASRIYRYDVNFAYMGTITVSGIQTDTEGLSYVEGNDVLIISEDGQASKLDIDENTTDISGRIPTSQRYKIMAPGGNKGTEGIAVRKSIGSQLARVYAVKEGTGGSNMRVVSFDMPDPDPGVLLDYQSNLTVNEPWDADVALAGSANDLAGAVFDERTGNLIILSQESRRAIQVDPDTGAIISTLNVSGAPQYEGVTIGPNGELVFVSEANWIRIYTLN